VARIDLPGGDGEESSRMWSLRPAMGAAVAAFGDSLHGATDLPIREQEAARIRIAHINGCIPCSEARLDNMDAHGLTEDFYAHVDDPAFRGIYSPREALAIGFAERFAIGPQAFDDAFWSDLRAQFDDGEIVDLAACCAKWLGLGRLNAVMEIERSCPIRISANGEQRVA
jgi:alkylhydroperoxidase family enzyme